MSVPASVFMVNCGMTRSLSGGRCRGGGRGGVGVGVGVGVLYNGSLAIIC